MSVSTSGRDAPLSTPQVGVGVLVCRGNDVLLVRRHGSHGSGTWSPPGGYLDFGEDPAECAVREAREETDVEVAPPRFAGATNDVFREEGKHFVTLWFEAQHVGREPRTAAPDELSEVGWFARGGLPAPLFLPFENFLAGQVLRA
jgi:8-oxo-dGTP diphosphatase